MREERKEQKLDEKLWQREGKKRAREMDRAKEEEVRAAYESLKRDREEGKTIPIDSLVGQTFNLFCTDYVDHFFDYSDYSTKRVGFYRIDNKGDICLDPKLSSETDMLYALVYLNGGVSCDFGPFRPPKRGSLKDVKAKSDLGGKYELSVKFLGNGYLKLRVSREMVFMENRSSPPPSTAPEVFEFVGIWCDPKEKAKRSEERWKSLRPSSPQTMFDINHEWY
ncbi:hypothetical protein B0I37DRAFT_374661 [Chaetomium sp. MPI-CAGE-AT-0009]|nr:hypothetical protein B0I37DRAFT_374661 [Chaetomium sp. MPI-CAGE-AT-0009]